MDAASYLDLKPNPNIPDFRSGDAVRVHAKVVEGERERIQVFEGVVIRIRRGGVNSNFTVRRVTHSVGVERTFPYYSPLVDKVEVSRVGRVRRSRLYYLRERVGKAARIKPGSRARFEALTAKGAVMVEEEYVEEEDVAEVAVIEGAQEETTDEPAAEADDAEFVAPEEPAADASEETPPEDAPEAAAPDESADAPQDAAGGEPEPEQATT